MQMNMENEEETTAVEVHGLSPVRLLNLEHRMQLSIQLRNLKLHTLSPFSCWQTPVLPYQRLFLVQAWMLHPPYKRTPGRYNATTITVLGDCDRVLAAYKSPARRRSYR